MKNSLKKKTTSDSLYDKIDCSRNVNTDLKQLDVNEFMELIKDCFVTGKWSGTEDAQQLLDGDEG